MPANLAVVDPEPVPDPDALPPPQPATETAIRRRRPIGRAARDLILEL
jgi:hypothetical protein